MNIKSLRIFVRIMEEGTLAQAAVVLNVSQPAASRLLGLLEQEIGCALFHRDKKRLVPTAEAELFYPEAMRILASLDGVPALFDQMRKNVVAPLRVICHPRIVNGLVLPAIAEASGRDPELRIKLEIHHRRDLGRRIMHGQYDIGISTLPLPVEKLAAHALVSTELHVALPREHSLADREFLTAQDVAGEPYIALDESTVIRRIVDRALLKAERHLAIAHEVSAGAAAYRLVRYGLGFTFADPLALDPDLVDQLALVPWRPASKVDFGYFLPEQPRRHNRLETMIDSLRSVIEMRCSGRSDGPVLSPGLPALSRPVGISDAGP
ncbi:MAG: LysR family transcriptional regulator [Pseudomonadota bacterium]